MAVNYRDKRPFSTETVHMGTYTHPCEDLLVLKLEHRNIPYPNSAVLQKGKVIGKIDEVFGSVESPFVSVRLDGGCTVKDFTVESKFDGYKEKFMQRERFLPREATEKLKERDDRAKKDFKKPGGFRDRNKPGFAQGRFANKGHDGKFPSSRGKPDSFHGKKSGGSKGEGGFRGNREQGQARGKGGSFAGGKARSDFRKKE